MQTNICVVGLGYVGLPLACLLSKKFSVVGFDINADKIADLKNGIDETGEVEDLSNYNIEYSADPAVIKQANFIIVAVPTPIDDNKEPDLRPVTSASITVGKHLSKGAVVVYESTVYPGCTEEVCLPILEKESGLKLGEDFKLGYSPERVNPGDKQHTIDKIVKVVSGNDAEALTKVAEVYGTITTVHKASSIKVAEAAKVIENVQRDLNIALMNELAMIFDKLGIDTKEVVEAAGTKWNFNQYYPGLVGGHCIGVDPYYLTYQAKKKFNYSPKVILAGRDINESMASFVARKLKGRKKVLILGLTFKEDVSDTRNSKAENLVRELKYQHSIVFGYDTILKNSYHEKFGVGVIANWPPKEMFDAIIMFSPHRQFKETQYSLENLRKVCGDSPVLFDIKGFYNRQQAEKLGFKYLTL